MRSQRLNFQINALPAGAFAQFLALTGSELADIPACRQSATAKPGTPCRVSMADAEIGETVTLLHYAYQLGKGPQGGRGNLRSPASEPRKDRGQRGATGHLIPADLCPAVARRLSSGPIDV